MLEIGQIKFKVSTHFSLPNMVLLAGSGQNVGKTSFAVEIIKQFKKFGFEVYGLKITPHFHKSKPEHLIVQTNDYQISLEKDNKGNKDSSRMLKAGADEVFFIQTNSDSALTEAFGFVHRMVNKKVIWVCESGSLRSFVEPGLFLYFNLKGQVHKKDSSKKLIPLADRIVEFDGTDFDFSPEQISASDYRFKIVG